jgi:hypothetical protein
MRRMLPSPAGYSFSINLNKTINLPQTIELDPIWDMDSLSVVVFVQSVSSKTVYQSTTISYDELTITNVENNNSTPSEFKLYQNYPNPFNPSTVISYQLPVSTNVSLKVYDLLGRKVAMLVNEYKDAGSYEVEFSASGGSISGGDTYNLSSGVYIYRLQAGNFSQARKLILLR